MSNLRTELDVDDPLVLDSAYKIGTVADRRKVDDQIQDIQRVLVDGLISGHTDSFFELSTASDPLDPADIFCLSQAEDEGTLVTKATSDKLVLTRAIVGLATTAVTPGTKFRGITRGIIPRELFSLGPGPTALVGVLGTTGRLGRAPDADIGDTIVGFCDIRGTIVLTGSGSGTGSGGGGITPVGTPSDTDIIAWSATLGQWLVVPRALFSITAFAAATTLVEVGATAVNPAFAAALSAALVTGDTAVLTNNVDSEAKDVHSTPTSFASSHSFPFTAPNQTKIFTYTVVKAGNPVATRTAQMNSAQRNYAGAVATGATLAALIAGASYNVLDIDGLWSFTITDNGTHQVMIARPTRFGLPVLKDHDTGFGVGITFLRTTHFTNPSGFLEDYDQYTLDAPINGTKHIDVIA